MTRVDEALLAREAKARSQWHDLREREVAARSRYRSVVRELALAGWSPQRIIDHTGLARQTVYSWVGQNPRSETTSTT